ncbi:MAG: ribosome-associated translation inhibitor RaiA [Bacteroidetes bacterium]|jgi:putative sigma-54 modulation protein|nr:ribosome-associated translation inhibitor RaiA [Bacteroidota bacterium]MDA0974263.1 ribosome-associated translation inhibitor RaiA [Bacteroidota bacterium]
MEVEVRSVHFTADVKLINFINDKLKKLEQFHDNIINSEVFLRLDNNNELTNKITEIRMNIPGTELFAKKQCKSFEEATDEAVEALRRQLRKRKGKLNQV